MLYVPRYAFRCRRDILVSIPVNRHGCLSAALDLNPTRKEKKRNQKERKKKKKKWSSVTIVDFSSFVLAKKKKEMSWAAINPLVMLMTKRFSVMRWRHVDAVLTRNMRQCLLENATRTIDRKKVARKPRRRWNCQPTCFKKH